MECSARLVRRILHDQGAEQPVAARVHAHLQRHPHPGGEFCPQASCRMAGWDAGNRHDVCQGDHTHPALGAAVVGRCASGIAASQPDDLAA